MIQLVACYKPLSVEMDETIIEIARPGEKIGGGTHLTTSERDIEFQYRHGLPAVLAKLRLEKAYPNIEIDIFFTDTEGRDWLAISNHPKLRKDR